jgi:hypothetical protein
VYIPIQPSQYDVWTLEHMHELVVAAQGFNPTLAAFVLLTRVSTHPLVVDTAEAQCALEGLEPLQLARVVREPDAPAHWRVVEPPARGTIRNRAGGRAPVPGQYVCGPRLFARALPALPSTV